MPVESDFFDPSFATDVIRWQKQHGRHKLPWQNTTDAYRIWLSEIMLQQTQVAAVVPYYQKFLQSFPTVQVLAAAPSNEVMAHWSGLGYYTRARNLHKCAQQIVERYDGHFSEDPALLMTLPGIGRSTAAAIAAFAYGTRAAIMDGNVKRVFARVFGVSDYPGEKKTENLLWQRAEALLPEVWAGSESGIQSDIQSYTQGLMDLGATVCTRSRPACARCPLAYRCIALATDRVALLPIRKPKRPTPEKHAVMLVVIDRNQVLLTQRPEHGIWGGLLSLPEMDGFTESSRDAVFGGEMGEVESDDVLKKFHTQLRQKVSAFGVMQESIRLQTFSHGFTHFKLHVTPYRIMLAERLVTAAQSDDVWLDLHRVAGAPLPAPIKKLLLALTAKDDLFASMVSRQPMS